MLREQHRHFAETVFLLQPIAAYEGATTDGCLEWPADITTLYERAFFQGRRALNRAWQEIPASAFIGLIDTIKTRVLRFALELQNDLGEVSDDITRLPETKITDNVTVNIFGGTNVIASKDFMQVSHIEIKRGDWAGLVEALKAIGVQRNDIAELKTAVDDDSKNTTIAPVAEGRTAKWLKKFGKDAGQLALKTSVELAKGLITKWLTGYFGVK